MTASTRPCGARGSAPKSRNTGALTLRAGATSSPAQTRASTAAASLRASARLMSGNRPSVILRIRPLTRVWTTKDFAPEGWTRNPKLLSVPSQRVYSRAFGLAAAMAATFSRVFPVLFGMICFPLPATGQRAADDPGNAPRCLPEMAVGRTGVTLGGAGIGMAQQSAHGVEVEAAHHRMGRIRMSAVVDAHGAVSRSVPSDAVPFRGNRDGGFGKTTGIAGQARLRLMV